MQQEYVELAVPRKSTCTAHAQITESQTTVSGSKVETGALCLLQAKGVYVGSGMSLCLSQLRLRLCCEASRSRLTFLVSLSWLCSSQRHDVSFLESLKGPLGEVEEV